MEKMTKRNYFEGLKEIVEGANIENADKYIEFLDRQIELVSKKRNTPTKTQVANAELADKIYDFIANAEGAVTIDAIVAEFELSSGQKASALTKKLVDEGKVVKTKEDKKVAYTVAE